MECDKERCAPNVLIIGASRDLGYELGKQFASKFSKIMIASRSEVQLDLSANDIRSGGARAISYMQCDINDYEQVENLLESAQKILGCIDIIVYNAGASMQACFRTIQNLNDFREIISVNYSSLVYVAKKSVELLMQPQNANVIRPYECKNYRNSRPRFVATIGISGQTGIPEWSIYSGAKHAANAFLKALRYQVKEYVDVVIAYPNLFESSRVNEMILANGKPAGNLGSHIMKQWWFKEDLFFQPVIEAAKKYFQGILKHKSDIYLHRLDQMGAYARKYSPELSDLLHFLAFRVTSRIDDWVALPVRTYEALKEARCLEEAFKVCGEFGPCSRPTVAIPDIIRVRATRTRVEKEVNKLKEADAKSETKTLGIPSYTVKAPKENDDIINLPDDLLSQ